MKHTYEAFTQHLQKIAHLNSAMALLSWDQEIYMPEKGAAIRAQQFSTISGMVHELSTDAKFEEAVKFLLAKSSFGFKERRNLEETLDSIRQNKKLPADFIQRSAMARSTAFQSWEAARKKESFEVFKPALKTIVDLEREKAKLLGFEGHPYNALLNLYEKNSTVEQLDKLFNGVREKIVPLINQVAEKEMVNDSFLKLSFNKDDQFKFSIELLKLMGYDFDAGRQDLSTHPFTINFNSQDVRVTTRVAENDLAEVIWSTIHEGGHGLYEQGLPNEHYGLPSGEYVSLGIHESQSRIWENNVGREKHWWQFLYPKLQAVFPEQLGGVTLDEFYKGMNKVEPSLIRTSADELTYHVHVMIRYEIEKALIEETIEVDELEEVWNEKYSAYLGVTPSKPTEGVLQDIHWSHGSLGYFPTYSVGSFYAAQFYKKATQEIIDLEKQLSIGNTKPFLHLMRDKIHQHGKVFTAEQLCKNWTGKPLNIDYFVEYATKKYTAIYNL